MGEEKISLEFRLKNIKAIKNYFIKEIDQNELMSKKHKKVYTILNYTEHCLTLVSAITGCVSVSAFASLLGIPRNYKFYKKMYESIIKKKKKSMIKYHC